MEFTFDDFKKRALSKSLSKWEKIGFPDSYRENNEELIFDDICNKLGFYEDGLKILDIGCGCSGLVEMLIKYTDTNNCCTYLVDSDEMLNNINKEILNENIILIPGFFPNINYFEDGFDGFFDRILIYSVIQYAFLETSMFKFIHKCIQLLKPGGLLLIGDIPNLSARDRFLESDEGIKFKEKGTSIKDTINIKHDRQERIDDSIIISILTRYRNFGCETYLLPQPKSLPFGNRREDILIVKR